jgi:hypothetical protein
LITEHIINLREAGFDDAADTLEAIEAENIRLRDGIAYVLMKHPYLRLRVLMTSLLDGYDPAITDGSVDRMNSKFDAMQTRAVNAENELAALVRAIDSARVTSSRREQHSQE